MKIKVSNGNSKIGNDTLIINMNSATDCPSKKLGLCKHCDKCYAMKAERMYKQVLPYRRKQSMIWSNTSANDIADQIIGIADRRRKNKVKYLRFSESGDFTNQNDIVKMNRLAKLLKEYKITTYGYTARKDLRFRKTNFTVNGTGFMRSNNFYTVKKYSKADKFKCKGNCRACNLCKSAKGLRIAVELH